MIHVLSITKAVVGNVVPPRSARESRGLERCRSRSGPDLLGHQELWQDMTSNVFVNEKTMWCVCMLLSPTTSPSCRYRGGELPCRRAVGSFRFGRSDRGCPHFHHHCRAAEYRGQWEKATAPSRRGRAAERRARPCCCVAWSSSSLGAVREPAPALWSLSSSSWGECGRGSPVLA